MKYVRTRVALSVVGAALVAGCSGGPPAPGELKTLDTVCDRANDGKRVAVEGHLSLPESFSERRGSESAPLVIRAAPQPGGPLIFVWMPYGEGPNSMDRVAAQYRHEDLKVRTNDGATVSVQDKVRISGTVVFPSQSPMPGARCGFNTPLVEKL